MGQNLIDLLKSFAELITSMGFWGGSFFIFCLIIVLALGVVAIFHDVNDNPNHWSRKGNVHDWSPESEKDA